LVGRERDGVAKTGICPTEGKKNPREDFKEIKKRLILT